MPSSMTFVSEEVRETVALPTCASLLPSRLAVLWPSLPSYQVGRGFFFCCFLSKPTAVRQPLPVFCCPHLSSVNFRSYIYSSCSVIWFSFCFSPPLIVDINYRQSSTHLALVFWTNSCLPEGLLWISAWWPQVEANTVSENTTFQGAGQMDCCDKKGLRVFHV